MSYSVYTPPDWTPEESLPLMVFLHGARDNHETFDRYHVGDVLDEEINSGRVPRVIIVNPDGEFGFWENWHDGSRLYRDWVVKDLMPHVASRYNTLSCPENCFISGISMGGHGAMRFGYYEPDTFSSVSSVSAPIISKLHPPEPSIGGTILKWFIPIDRIWGDIDGDTSHVPKDLDPYRSWVSRERLFDEPLFLVWGTDDPGDIVSSNEHFHQHLEANEKEHDWLVYEGGHDWTYWREIVGSLIQFHVNAQIDEPIAKR